MKLAEERTNAGADGGPDARAETKKIAEAGRGSARCAFAHAEQFGGDSHSTAEQVGIDAVSLAESVEAGELLLQLAIRERDLVLLALARVGLRLLAAELRHQVAKTGRVVRGGQAIGGALAQRVERGIRGAQALLRDCGLLLWRKARAVEQALDRGHHQRAILSSLLIGLRDELVLLSELLIGQRARRALCSSGHGSSVGNSIERLVSGVFDRHET